MAEESPRSSWKRALACVALLSQDSLLIEEISFSPKIGADEDLSTFAKEKG
jgi:hypothetical protein